MRDTVLEDIVLDSLKQHIREVVDMSELLSMTDTAPLRTARAQKVQRQLEKKHEEYEKLQKLLMSLYENLADGIIDREEYTRLKQNLPSGPKKRKSRWTLCGKTSRISRTRVLPTIGWRSSANGKD